MSYLKYNKEVEKKIHLLRQFKVPLDNSVEEKLYSLADNSIALDRYVRKLIKEFLFKGEEQYE